MPLTSLKQRYEPQLSRLGGSETAKAVGLAGAMVANNVIALGSVIVFSRLLTDYGSLAALVSYFLILAVVGYAMQLATAREAVFGHLGVGRGMAATIRSWTKSVLLFTAVMTVVSVLLRHPIAVAVGVKQDWAAALGIPAGCLYLLLCIMRGFLQGLGDYKAVGISLIGEQAARLAMGGLLAAVGLGVTGAYVATPLSFLVMILYCAVLLRRHLGTAEPGYRPAIGLGAHVRSAWAAIAALGVIAVLQNIDIIAAKHQFSTDMASSYSAIAVAAKVLIWVAMGAGFYLVPEVSRRHAAGEDTRPVLAKAVAIVAVAAVPCLLIYAFASAPADPVCVRRASAARGRLVVHSRGRVHGAGRHLPGGPVHARAQADVVPAGDRRGRRRRADPPAPGLEEARELRDGGARGPGRGSGARVRARAASRQARRRRPRRAGARPGRARARRRLRPLVDAGSPAFPDLDGHCVRRRRPTRCVLQNLPLLPSAVDRGTLRMPQLQDLPRSRSSAPNGRFCMALDLDDDPSLPQVGSRLTNDEGGVMAVTKIIELVGSSPNSSDDAVRAALAEAQTSLRNIKAVDVVSIGLRGDNLDEWRALVRVSFLVERVSE